MNPQFRAKRLPWHTGPAAWNVILQAQAPAEPLDKTLVCDVVIIGGGFAGLSAARRFRQLRPDARIVMLEAGRIAEAASGRNSGFMIDLPHELTSSDYCASEDSKDLKMTRLNRLAIRFAAEAVQEYRISPDFFDPAGKVNGAASEQSHRQNHSYAAHLDNLGEPYEMLDADAMHEMTGSRYYLSGLYTPGTVLLQPAGYVRALADGLRRTIKIFENTPALSFTRLGTHWHVTTPNGAVHAEQVILANNGHLESFGFQHGRLMHIFLFACMTQELGLPERQALGGQPRWGLTPSDPMGTTVRKIDTAQGGHRIVMRTGAVFRPSMSTTPAQMQRALRVMRDKFADRFPSLAQLKMEHAWSGHLCLSWNGVSVVNELEDGVFSACCQNGLGTTRGVLTGIAAAESACKETSEVTRYFTAEDRPSRLAPEPLARVGANTFLRWKAWRARRD